MTEAQRAGRGIALENFTGILPFSQVDQFIEYKSKRSRVPLIYVGPANTSQACHVCENVDRKSRTDHAAYRCCACGVVAHAPMQTLNAALNVTGTKRGSIARTIKGLLPFIAAS